MQPYPQKNVTRDEKSGKGPHSEQTTPSGPSVPKHEHHLHMPYVVISINITSKLVMHKSRMRIEFPPLPHRFQQDASSGKHASNGTLLHSSQNSERRLQFLCPPKLPTSTTNERVGNDEHQRDRPALSFDTSTTTNGDARVLADMRARPLTAVTRLDLKRGVPRHQERNAP
jgi:hypothetical protein